MRTAEHHNHRNGAIAVQLEEAVAHHALRIDVVLTEGLDESLAENGCGLVEESVAEPVHGARREVGAQNAQDEDPRDHPPRFGRLETLERASSLGEEEPDGRGDEAGFSC